MLVTERAPKTVRRATWVTTKETMIGQDFQPSRLRLARELAGLTQAALARGAGVSSAAVSQFESGAHRPARETIRALADRLEVPTDFFTIVTAETHEGFFRSLKRTTVSDRRRARALAHVAHDLAVDPVVRDRLPLVSLPRLPVHLEALRETVEELAGQLRRTWGITPGPLGNLVELAEAHGIVVIRLPLDSADVDAFSLPFPDRPVIVLGADKNDRARSRFDTAHEIGHLVMHGDQVFGLKEIEQQAHWFSAALLMPAEEIGPELPQTLSWSTLFELKQRWQVSLAALLMRARTLKVMSEPQYLTAIKTASARGWRRVEPVPLGEPERPSLIRAALARSKDAPTLSALPSELLSALADVDDE